MLIKNLKAFFLRYRTAILFIAVAAFVLPEVTVYFSRPGRGSDIFGYFQAGNDVLHREDLYRHSQPGKNNTWPPFFSFFMVPLSLSAQYLGIPVTKELWYLFNFSCLLAAMQLWMQLIYGKRPALVSRNGFDFSSHKVFVPFLLLLPPFVATFFMLQINVFILFLVTLGFFSLKNRSPCLSGFCFGFAASLKAFPGLVVLYLIVRRQWKAAAYSCAFGLLFTIFPLIIYGVHGYSDLIKHWLSLSFVQTLIVDNVNHNNQSLYAAWYRFLVYQLHLTTPGSLMLRSATLASIIVILCTTMALFIRNTIISSDKTLVIEYAALCIMMVLFPPIGWGHYFVFLFPAAAVAWKKYLEDRGFFASAVHKTAALAWPLLILIPYVSGHAVERIFQACSNYVLSALALLFLLLRML